MPRRFTPRSYFFIPSWEPAAGAFSTVMAPATSEAQGAASSKKTILLTNYFVGIHGLQKALRVFYGSMARVCRGCMFFFSNVQIANAIFSAFQCRFARACETTEQGWS